jgi:hypothetical protein
MQNTGWLALQSPAFRLMAATSWLAAGDWQKQQEQAIRMAIDEGPHWNTYLSLVERHRTPVLSWAALQRVPGLKLPDGVSRVLQLRSKETRMQALHHAMLLAQVLEAFNASGIPLMALKGPLLSLKLYGDIGLRQSHDLDVACALSDLPRACLCLQKHGWRMAKRESSLTPLQREQFIRHEHHMSFWHTASKSLLELHWRKPDETAEQAQRRWSRSHAFVWRNFLYLDSSENDLLLYLCAHGCRHMWFRVKWLGDIARLHTMGKIDWDSCIEEARELGQERLLLIAQRLLKEVYGLATPAENQRERDSRLPHAVVSMTLNALASSKPQGTVIRYICAYRYDWLVLPQKSFREAMKKLFYRGQDYLEFPLPDRLFWMYVPLRPLLFIWRRVIRICQKHRSSTT